MKKRYAKAGFNRKRRLAAAKHWLPKFTGKNIVRGYRKNFGVDWVCAINELKMLGIDIDPTYEAQLRLTVANNIKTKQQRKEKKKQEEMERRRLDFYPDSDEYFAYIAGYTPAGFPFGVTWEEMERFNELESLIEMLEQEKMGEAEKLQQMTDMEEWLAFLAKEEKRGK
jgi:hypothetical protein